MKKILKDNAIIPLYAVLSVLVELFSVFSIDGTFYIKNPIITLSLLVISMSILFLIKNTKKRYALSIILLSVKALLVLVFIVVFDMTGTYFDFGMLKLRNDAFGILESIPMRFLPFYFAVFAVFVLVAFGRRAFFGKRSEHPLYASIIAWVLIISSVFSIASTSYSLNKDESKYNSILYDYDSSVYTQIGITGNFANEIIKGMFFRNVEKISDSQVNEFLYKAVKPTSDKFGISKDKNLIVVLVESFEWYSFITSDEYPNALGLSQEEIEYLLPNITDFYKKSVVATNFHSREKTDISESLSIIGAYPTDAYINYDFPKNVVPFSVPAVMKLAYGEDITARYFHNGFGSFYNRDVSHVNTFGFDDFFDCYRMYEMGDTMYNWLGDGERNLDSEMFETCKDYMFPRDERFISYITTITMHGMYYERESLKEHYKKLVNVLDYDPEEEADPMRHTLINYISAVMDFDNALGIMMNDLREKGLLENTTIVLFGDHNTYYHGLSGYVKDIHGYDTENYFTDLYKVPLMIYDTNLEHQVIDKFTVTADIVPTIMDLFGINIYDNMYYGNSIFTDRESVLYSRAYAIFLADGLVFKSLNNRLYKHPSVTDEYENASKEKMKELVEKIKFNDQIFYHDFFRNDDNLNLYYEKFKEINK